MNNQITELPQTADVAADLEVMDYVAGRMTDTEHEAFSARIQQDPDLAAIVQQEIAFRDALVSTAGPDDMPGPGAFGALRSRIEDESSHSARYWKPLAIAASLAVALLVANQVDSPEPAYETLSSDPAQAVTGGLRYRVIFATGVDQSLREGLAATYGFDIVSGPGPGGAFIVETLRPVSADQLDKWLGDESIDFAEPVNYE